MLICSCCWQFSQWKKHYLWIILAMFSSSSDHWGLRSINSKKKYKACANWPFAKTRPPSLLLFKPCLSRHTSCSHAVKNTLRKEKTDNVQTDKTEQVTLGMKKVSAFRLSFLRNSNTVLWLFNVSWQIAVALQFKQHVNWSSLPLF